MLTSLFSLSTSLVSVMLQVLTPRMSPAFLLQGHTEERLTKIALGSPCFFFRPA